MRTRHGMKIVSLEPTSLFFNQFMYFGHGEAVAGGAAMITVAAVARMGHRLNDDTGTLFKLQPKFNQRAKLAAVVTFRNRRHDDRGYVQLFDDLNTFHLHVDQFDTPRFWVNTGAQSIELQRGIHTACFELLGKFWIVGYAPPVRRNKQALYLARMRSAQHVVAKLKKLRVQRGFS